MIDLNNYDEFKKIIEDALPEKFTLPDAFIESQWILAREAYKQGFMDAQAMGS